MDKLEKSLRKLGLKERLQIKAVLNLILRGQTKNLDVKKLKDRNDIFRIRKGELRIIYRVQGNEITILSIGRRNDNTYKL